MWVRTMEGKLVNLAMVACVEWYHLGPDSDTRADIYDVRAQVGRQDEEYYFLARNLTQQEAESLLNFITKHISTHVCLDLRDYKTHKPETHVMTS
ncbi:MAG TPA: hypothetical protein VFB38_21025 [Chthonomonadaceae bacterium]|nr:hypothetical protein [Chthonomonadaceae bacterium]